MNFPSSKFKVINKALYYIEDESKLARSTFAGVQTDGYLGLQHGEHFFTGNHSSDEPGFYIEVWQRHGGRWLELDQWILSNALAANQ